MENMDQIVQTHNETMESLKYGCRTKIERRANEVVSVAGAAIVVTAAIGFIGFAVGAAYKAIRGEKKEG